MIDVRKTDFLFFKLMFSEIITIIEEYIELRFRF
jgi:hypothetical protein